MWRCDANLEIETSFCLFDFIIEKNKEILEIRGNNLVYVGFPRRRIFRRERQRKLKQINNVQTNNKRIFSFFRPNTKKEMVNTESCRVEIDADTSQNKNKKWMTPVT